MPGGQFFLIELVSTPPGHLGTRMAASQGGLLHECGESAPVEQVIEDLVEGLGHSGFSKIMHTSCKPGMNAE